MYTNFMNFIYTFFGKKNSDNCPSCKSADIFVKNVTELDRYKAYEAISDVRNYRREIFDYYSDIHNRRNHPMALLPTDSLLHPSTFA